MATTSKPYPRENERRGSVVSISSIGSTLSSSSDLTAVADDADDVGHHSGKTKKDVEPAKGQSFRMMEKKRTWEGEAPVTPLEKPTEPPAPAGPRLLTGKRLAVAFSAMLLCTFLIALDQTILSTALPVIASDFDAFTQQGWISSGFVLGQTAFLLPFSQFLRIVSAKWVLLGSIIVFEAGSTVCGAATSAEMLIGGRALAGAAAAGAYTAVLQAVSQSTRFEDRPKLFGLFGAVFGLSSVIGPLIGGALTDSGPHGWRWCFYINLPIGGLAFAGIFLLLDAAPPLGADVSKRTRREAFRQILHMDWMGLILVLGGVTSLVLALNWGGVEKPWSDYSVIVSFVMTGVSFLLLILWEGYLGMDGMIPYVIFKNFSCYAISLYNFLSRFTLLLPTYYLPILFQATRAHSATKSGLDLLPFMLLSVVTVIVAGQLVSRYGRYWPFLVGAPVFVAVGSGLLYTVTPATSQGILAAYQIILGAGVGGLLQGPLIAAQAEFRNDAKHLAQATGMATFCQFLGGTIALSIGESVFSSQLETNLEKYAPAVDAAIVKRSPLAIYTDIPEALRPSVINAYARSLRAVFIIGAPIAVILMITALGVKNRSVKFQEPDEDEEIVDDAQDDAAAGAGPRRRSDATDVEHGQGDGFGEVKGKGKPTENTHTPTRSPTSRRTGSQSLDHTPIQEYSSRRVPGV